MPFIGRESADNVSDPPPPIPPAEIDALLSAILDHLAGPLVHRIAEGVAYDRHTERYGGALLPAAERAQQIASSALSDAEFALRQTGDYLPTRGQRLIRQFAAKLAERVLRRHLTDLEVSPASVDAAVNMLWAEEAGNDQFRAVAQISAAREPADPPVLEPVEIPNTEARS